jgi:RNA polymerase sigma-70 factor, ECF subfamily
VRAEDFEALWEAHAQPLFGFLAYRTGNRALAEELVAETFSRALAARSRFDRGRGKESTWLYAIALNLVRDNARRAKAQERREERVAALGAGERDQIAAADDRVTLMAALEVLAPEEREALALRYGSDLTVPEVAQALNEPLTTVEGRIYRGLRKLRDHIDV